MNDPRIDFDDCNLDEPSDNVDLIFDLLSDILGVSIVRFKLLKYLFDPNCLLFSKVLF